MKKTLSLLLAILVVCMSLPMCAIGVFAIDETAAFVSSYAYGGAGEIVTVDISTQDNPGIISLKLNVDYDPWFLEYIDYNTGDFDGVMVNAEDGHINILWMDALNPNNNTTDGIIASLNFRINDGIYDCETPIDLSYNEDDVYNVNFDNVAFFCENSTVYIYPCAHTELDTHVIDEREATCTEDGYIETETRCATCGMFLSQDIQSFDAYGHNIDGSGNCLYCGEYFDIPVLSTDMVRGKPGETTGTFITLSNNPGISNLRVYLQYDTSALEFVSYETVDLNNIDIDSSEDGTVVIDWYHSEGKNRYGDIIIGYAEFKIKEDAVKEVYPFNVLYHDGDITNVVGDNIFLIEYPGFLEVYYCDHYNVFEQSENQVEPTCVQNGSYDKVLYCSDCKEELSRSSEVTNATGHNFIAVDAVDGTCTQKGTIAHLHCDQCGGNYELESDAFASFDQMLTEDNILTTYKHTLDDVGYCVICKDFIGTAPTFYVSSAEGYGQETVAITISTKNNPGIVSAKLKIAYDDTVLELVDKTAGSAFSGMAYGASITDNPYIVNWVDTRNPDNTANDTFVTLIFKIKRGAKGGSYPITVTYDSADVFNRNFDAVEFAVVDGAVIVHACEHNNYEVVTNEVAATCTQDGSYTVIHTCLDCDEQIFIQTNVIKATGHDVDENSVCYNCGEHIIYPTVVVGNASGKAGDTISVPVSIINNPGIISIKLKISYDSNLLEPIDITQADFSNTSFSPIGNNPLVINYVDGLNGNNYDNGVLANIIFKIKEDVLSGDYSITASYDQDDVFDDLLNNVFFITQSGVITVYDCLHENTNTVIENRVSPTCLLDGQYFEVTYCDDCGKLISSNKVIVACEGHSFESVAQKEANCTQTGNIEYKYCVKCNKNFKNDSDAFTPDSSALSEKDITIPYKHTPDASGKCVLCGQYAFEEPTIIVSTAKGINGKTVEITISLANNPGIISSKLSVTYDSNILELVSRTPGLNGMAFSAIGTNPYIVNWVDSINPNNTMNGVFVTLAFKIKDDAELGYSPIKVSYNPDDIFNEDYNNVTFDLFDGGIEVIECTHTSVETIVENNILPTCLHNGSYENVTICLDCYDELSRDFVTVDALGHDEIVHIAYAPSCTDIGWDEYVTCSRCDYTTYNEKSPLGHKESEAVVENNMLPTCTETGSYDVVVYCSVCNDELAREYITVAPTGHKGDEALVENTIEPTCTENGSYEMVVYCLVCGEQLSRQTVITDALGHTESFPVVENYIAPTCTDEGYYDNVIYCFDCGEELSRWGEIVDALGHTEGEPVVENEVLATCTENGSYEMVLYCFVCNEEISRNYIAVEAYGHNIILWENQAPTCTEIGWYTYEECTHCGYTTYAEIPALGHDEIEHTAKEPTCTETGWYAYCTCSRCDYTTYVERPAIGHTQAEAVVENVVNPTCTDRGSYDSVVYCSVCGYELSRQTKIVKALGHTKSDIVVTNVVAPECEIMGKYDNICYCTVCNAELSRVTVETAKGHKLDVNGKCSVCGVTIKVPTIFVTSSEAFLGKEVRVDVVVKNNPGIVSMKLNIEYDENVFELVDKQDGAFTKVSYGPMDKQPFVINWVDSLNPDNTTDGVVATLVFRVKDESAIGTSVITVDYYEDDVYNSVYENISFEKNYGFINVRDYKPGDVNDDGKVNNKDLALLMQYIIGDDVVVNVAACNVNADGKINNRDYALLMQYINGWSVELVK